jgi:hypothetical protein
MKKIFLTLFVLHSFMASFSQTLLSSHPLELKKSSANHQILNAVNNQKQVFVFASDKENLTVLKYNQALFFKDSLSVPRPEKSYEFMAGFSFEENGNPYLYWSSEDYKKIEAVYFDFENKRTVDTYYQIPFKEETILNAYSENNSFYILSQIQKEDKLKLYCFSKGKLEENILDFSSYKFMDESGKSKTFGELLEQNPIEKIDTKSLNPLFYGTAKTKLYVLDNKMILTFDSPTRTQALEIDLSTFSISEKIIPQQTLTKGTGKSNSYFHQNKLYQLKTSEEELIIASIDFKSGELIKSYSVTQNDAITFKNSPLYSQTGTQQGRELKNTKKFLQKLDNSEIGLSVYKTPDAIMITAGGIKNVGSTGGILLGITAGVAMVAAGNDASSFGELFDVQNLQSIYFEGLFDENFQHKKIEQQGLAVDYISQFIDENNVSLESVFPYNDYFIMGYYDSKAKEYVMRKFEDFSN